MSVPSLPSAGDNPGQVPAASASAPDVYESEHGGEMDNIISTQGYAMVPMVGLGGSAGSFPALQTFFKTVPADTGMVFVVVLHLAPDHPSLQAELLQRTTSMPVVDATDGVKVEPNCVYVIPAGKHLVSADGRLRLKDLHHPRGRRVAVDLFFRTLADSHGPRAAAVVLSGGDGDGAIGIKRIKERGGLTIAQDPAEAEADGMPRSAIATGMVDWVLPVVQMPARLIGYHRMEHRLQLPPEDAQDGAAPGRVATAEVEDALREILAFVRTRTGRDFSCYKRATIVRRIGRRMQVNGVGDLPWYLSFLRTNPGETGALLQDLLISVTNFFRDREVFTTLEAALPGLFKGKGAGDVLRVWVAACASGEEAYSVAMLLAEHSATLESPPILQVFASDLDEQAIRTARDGAYPDTIVADVSEERLRRFFIKETAGYRVRRDLREIVLFVQHDLLKDSPFSRLELVTCRNLLIYLNREAQARALATFHFALKPEGLLLLGSSESVDEGSLAFATLDKKHRLYSRRANQGLGLPLSGPTIAALPAGLSPVSVRQQPYVPGRTFDARLADSVGASAAESRGLPWGELHYKLVERLAPPSLIINATYEIVHLSVSAGRFLEFAGGEPTKNLLEVVHPALRIELRAALYRAAQDKAPVEAPGVIIELRGETALVRLRIAPAAELAPDFFLVLFDSGPTDASAPAPVPRVEPDSVARQLEGELERMKLHLRETTEQHDASSEELKASNEELQAMNEELRSATEELQTSREELQSINEELTTVNQELKSKVDELAYANSDLRNLMASTAIATVFLDRELRIKRYTPSAVALFNFIPTDIGRPLSDLHETLNYPEFEKNASDVLDGLIPIEREIRGATGRCFLARLLPYRTTDDHIAGVVLTFVDISDRVHAEEALRQAHELLETRITERTAELAQANTALSAENAVRTQAEHARYEVTKKLMAAQEEERARISRGLHDEVGQNLMALRLGLKSLELPPGPAATAARGLHALVEKISTELRELALELRPTALDDLGLVRALRDYLEDWSVRTGIATDFHPRISDEPRLPSPVETTIFRIVKEVLNNVVKHAMAKSVNVVLEQRASQVVAIIEDDGAGFDVRAQALTRNVKHLGLLTIKERAALLDGEVTVESAPGRGTTVFVRLPLSPTTPHNA
jgi:two-component system CheB/CheR fusion protein